MKKIILFFLGSFMVAGCAGLEKDVQQDVKQEVLSFTQAPVSSAGENVRFVMEQPPQNCVFKGGIMGDANPRAGGLLRGLTDLSAQVEADLRNNAASMGGNTVWVRGAEWYKTNVSYDYDNPFIVSNVEYGALVYECPVN